MSQPTAESTEATDAPGEAPEASGGRGIVAALPGGWPRPSLTTGVAALALVPTAALTLARLLRNSPAGLPDPVQPAVPTVGTLAALVPPLAFLALGVAADRPTTRLAALALCVFPLLAVVDDAAWLPAAGAVVAGGTLAVAFALWRRTERISLEGENGGSLHALRSEQLLGPSAVSFVGITAVACSLAGAAGVAPLVLLPVGATATFLTLAALPALRPVDWLDLSVWLVAAVAVGWWATSAPFVAGAVTLVAFGAGEVPFLVLVAGTGGAVAAVVASLRRRAFGPAVAASLLLFAGVPGRLPRAVAFVLALVVLVREWEAGTGDGGTTDRGRSVSGGEAGA